VVALHAFLALAAGFVTMAALVAAMTALLARLTPGWVSEESKPGAGAVFVNLGASILAAAAGGCVTAWVAVDHPLQHVLVLAIIVLAMSALSALQTRGKQPVWAMLLLVALTPFGVLAGGLLRLKMMGLL